MTLKERIFLVLMVLGTGLANAATPQPSIELQRAFLRQAERVKGGSTDVAELIADLQQERISNDPVAKFMLATLILDSQSERAKVLLQESADAGCAGAMGLLGIKMTADSEEIGRLLVLKAARSGDAAAQIAVSAFFERGYPPEFLKNEITAISWANLAKRQSYSVGVKNAAMNSIDRLLGKLSKADSVNVATQIEGLKTLYPKIPFYLCGQSAP
jgi:hypothetical protein